MTTDDTPGLLAMLSRALKSKDTPSRSVSEPVLEEPSPREPDAAANSSTVEPSEAGAAVDVAETPTVSAEAAEQQPVAEPTPSEPERGPSRPASSYKVSTDEARDIVLRGLQRLPDFPTQGITVELYGSRPWSAMLVFAPGSTSHQNATRFRAALVEMVVGLRKQIDIEHGE